jgi:RNA polymerase sigma-54 factor
MKPSLQLKLGQHLTMTPQLQQAIRLLQLSTMDLQTEIQQTLEENPMLEIEEESTGSTSEREQQNKSESELNQQDEQLDLERTHDLPDELPVDSEWEDIYDIATAGISNAIQAGGENISDYLENQSMQGDTLAEHLLWQLRNMSTSDTDFAIGIAIIDAINDDGYLTESAEEIRAGLVDELDIELDEVEAVLHLIQHFDPIGVGARDLKECLLLQLDQVDESTEGLADVRMLIRDHLEQIGSRDYARLLKSTRLSEEKLQELITFIQSLNPKPGSTISPNRAEYIIPDIFVRKVNGEWTISLNPESAPKIRINPLYAGYVKKSGRGKDSSYLRNSMQEARWFLKSLQSRSDTLLRVGKAIVDRQRLFLEYGDEGMKPMVLRDIAEELDMHESTISRVTTQKYMHTPRGVFEFKFFFSSHVSTADGGECSATAIRAMVKKLIENENPRKPMSDNKISAFLVKEGINVARRTVAKYREAMSIPPSNERKRLV